MVQVNAQLTTGLPELDQLIKGLIPGDNVVWQVDTIWSYFAFVRPFRESAVSRGRKLIYFRFAKHEQLVPEGVGAEVHRCDPDSGFEVFLGEIHKTIERAGRGAFYIFDCLSDLTADWYSDQMLGNFFMMTCPYLFDLETIAYFALLRDYHSPHATTPISETTQLLLDVYRHRNNLYLQPRKVQQRYSATMHLLHVHEGDRFVPVTDSATVAEVLNSTPRSALETISNQLDVWYRAFLIAERSQDALFKCDDSFEVAGELYYRLLRMAVTRDNRVLELATRYFDLPDLLAIGKRMIGTGLIGGKTVGMLLARAILTRSDPRWENLLEVHDSFYIGSDVFYTFLVRNGCWWMREKQKDPNAFLEGAERARQRIMLGTFPPHIEARFAEMLDYFGQFPIIVRSSSLLEDNFGNSFAGKYDSVFCVNQGARTKRLEDFLTAVKTIYASTMSEKALSYRARFGILDRDEQMALLVQRVSGSLNGSYFFPHVAGVGFSFNPYVWSPYIDPEAGLLRLVFGLGTRAVDRFDDDYTRIIALNDPERRPEATASDVRRYTQRKVDVLDLDANLLASRDFDEVAPKCAGLPLGLCASPDTERRRLAAERGIKGADYRLLTFERLIGETDFVPTMGEMLQTLEAAYDYPVDVEFTANFHGDGSYRINLVQCRPLQVRSDRGLITLPREEDVPPDDLVFRTPGPVVGQSRMATVDRVIYVSPPVYSSLPLSERYSIARLIGKLTHLAEPYRPETIMLLGPGRWGTTTPSLGVPVSFAEINTVSVLCEIVAMRDDLVPDVSMGTHFFSELVEMDMLYLAIMPNQDGHLLNAGFFANSRNRLAELMPEARPYTDAVKVLDLSRPGELRRLQVCADTLTQTAFSYVGWRRG